MLRWCAPSAVSRQEMQPLPAFHECHATALLLNERQCSAAAYFQMRGGPSLLCCPDCTVTVTVSQILLDAPIAVHTT